MGQALLTEDQVWKLAEIDLHAALVEVNAPLGLLMNAIYTCLETIQQNPVYPLLLLESMEFATMVYWTVDARRRTKAPPRLNLDLCPVCEQMQLLE